MEPNNLKKQLFTTKGFDRRFYHHCAQLSQEEAYEATEREYQEFFPARKYANYKSFKSAFNRRVRTQLDFKVKK
jgi:hypothetical protein